LILLRLCQTFPVMAFPVTRLLRMRQSEPLRSLVRETRLAPANFIYPRFVCPGKGVRKEISSMPGVFNLSVDEAVKEAREAKSLGLGGIILFGLPEKRTKLLPAPGRKTASCSGRRARSSARCAISS